jgi:hypothetical protein
MLKRTLAVVAMLAPALLAGEYPEASIYNGMVRARLYLPDTGRGSYRGTRFDWSGIIFSLEYKGHQFTGRWYERHDPKIHDAITGPVEEFLTNGAGLGYDAAKPGENFIRIGVGTVRKPLGETEYRRFETYDIVDPGKRTVNTNPDSIEFVQDLNGGNGYAYHYRKVVKLTKGKPELVLEHTLKNTGKLPIETSVYDHNFFVIDDEVVGPDIVVEFPFEPKAVTDFKGLAEIKGKDLTYGQELQKGQTAMSELTGFGDTAKDYDFRVENRKSNAAVRIMGDRPLSKLIFWSIRAIACPEPYIQMNIAPGKEFKWRITYLLVSSPSPRPAP